LEQKLKKINTVKELKFFYLSLFKKFKHLNSKYKFNSTLKFSYIGNQIKNIDLKKKNIFFGIPFGIKDIFNTKFLKTEFGSAIFKKIIDKDAMADNKLIIHYIVGVFDVLIKL
jgi:Asp-tRNA(Asn)/Glu-tRNA(Gln) amidotransferase A subunit family amidase